MRCGRLTWVANEKYLPEMESFSISGICFFGGVSMCRYNKLWGGVMVAFALGVLLGSWLESGFALTCFGVALAFFGLVVLRRS